jgi:hypothetical protein
MLSFALCVAFAAPSMVLIAVGPTRPGPNDVFGGVGGLAALVVSLSYAGVGAIVVSRMPENRIGWLFCAGGVAYAAGLLAWSYADVGLHMSSGRLPAVRAAGLAQAPSEGEAALLGLSLLLFPDGRLPTRRWRPALTALIAGAALLVIANLLRPGQFDQPFVAVSNPIGISGGRGAMEAVDAIGWLLVILGTAAAAACPIVRLRRARGVKRQQLKLVLSAGGIAAVVATLCMTTWLIWPHGALQVRMAVVMLSVAVLPVAAGIAILRYRLYDIDVVINRTLVYGALTATLAGTYVGTVLLLQLALGGFTGDSGLAVAVSTLAVAALFRPARSRIQAAVDRRFYRRKFDAQRTLAAFAARLRDEVALDALSAELRGVVAETMQPAHVSLWLRGGPR